MPAEFPQPFFDEASTTPDPDRFKVPHPSDDATYNLVHGLLSTQVVSFDESRAEPGEMLALKDVWGPHGEEVIQRIVDAGQIVFHSVGDTGASTTKKGKYANELSVADRLTDDLHTSDPKFRPAFFFHLGDVVYDFAESQYWFDQFYEPYRNYPAPIFAIPGNHDSFEVPGTPDVEKPLQIFARNFCSTVRTITLEARSLHRTAMIQPGIYFTLEAPFARIIGMFSNALEDPGVISSQDTDDGKWAAVPDFQLEYLTAQLRRIKADNFMGAVLLAIHHPPFAYDLPPGQPGAGGNHGSSADMLRQIDTICKAEGVYPHAFLSGHVHNYQRYTRTIKFAGNEMQIPFIACGAGGHNINSLVRADNGVQPPEPNRNTRVDYLESNPAVETVKLVLEDYNDTDVGFLRVTVSATTLTIEFTDAGTSGSTYSDKVTLDLVTRKIIENSQL